MPDSRDHSIVVAPQEHIKVEIDVKLAKLNIKDRSESNSSDSSDSDIDIYDAIINSEELRTHLRSHVRSELATIAPKVFEKIRAEYGLEPIPS